MKILFKFFVGAWLAVSTLLIAFLMSTHMGVFKLTSMAQPVLTASADKKIYFHFLYAGCGCSREVAKRLTTLPPNEKELHRVYWIEEKEFPAPEFPVHMELITLTESSPEIEKIHGAPQLHVFEKNKLLYEGGYTHTKTTFLTNWVMDDLQQNRTPASAPVRGCYVPKKQNLLSTLWKKLI